MLRKTFAFLCTLFAISFLFGFQSQSRAQNGSGSSDSLPGVAGSFMSAVTGGTYVALAFTAPTATSNGYISISSDTHIYGSISLSNYSVVYSGVTATVTLTANVRIGGIPGTLSGTMYCSDTTLNSHHSAMGTTYATFTSTKKDGTVTTYGAYNPLTDASQWTALTTTSFVKI